MPKIPRSSEVRKAIVSLRQEVKLAVKAVNQHAAKLLARGDYEGAQAMIEVAQSLAQFGNDVQTLQSRWRDILGAGAKTDPGKRNQTALWEYYQPILRVLASLGGEATRKELETELEGSIAAILKVGDRVANARGMPKWKVMIRRARKPMTTEGFLADEKGPKWRITKKGEQAAQKASKKQ
ncbi:MAG: hypothetical protein ABIP48_32805 [Planctomycetota bacterium]